MVRQSGLGKGLGALIPVPNERYAEGLQEIPIGMIHPNRFQPRKVFSDEGLAALAASISELGVLQPILVRRQDDGFELVAGERRWQAAQRAGLTTIPAVIQDRDDLASLQAAVVENLHREDLNALEEAAAYRQLIDDFGLTHDAVAQRVGKSRAAISNTLRLLQLPSSVQRRVVDGTLSAGHARALLASPDRKLQERLADSIVDGGLSVREAEELVRQTLAGVDEEESGSPPVMAKIKSSTGSNLRPAVVLEVERLLSESLLTSVSIEVKKSGAGVVRLDFADLGDLHRIASSIVDPGFES
ncbi:ParB/RepB/Spo0J family partition protein [Ferrimicrobium acidiphilum]|uniref:Chromosome-partitioning protein Spo0J n=1 Tax=Ferrimicrobium acidiphilum DSM 19497 TaxID=1121877 RepID=A0A0D8FU15_9ACTN|nr:ParB/RepB/Spo0J family partition protein [Ferrimicrobium acidiphilum]KJE76449.1 chromosome-partitioning protein Spo0J [Ferrimicrobium acidiphilum DSM 19497]MCL5052785.1 ParB/RepB/Spo0J family partition protein [Gammaproteobacteria bacterium]